MYVYMYLPYRIPVLAAVCQTLTLPLSGLKLPTIQLPSCPAPSFTQASQTPMYRGDVFQMTPGSRQTSVLALSRIPQGIPFTF